MPRTPVVGRTRARLAPVATTLAAIGLFIGVWAVITTDVQEALGGGPGRLGLLLTVALIAAAAMNTVGGMLAERRGTTAALQLTLACWASALAVGSLAPAPWGVALGVLLALCGSGAVDVVANVAATAGLADRPGRLVQFHALFNLGGAIGAVCAGILVALDAGTGWRLAWALTALVVFVTFLGSLGTDLPAGQAGEQVSPADGLRILTSERLVPTALAFALGAMVEAGITTWGVVHLRGQLDAGLLVGAGGAVTGFLVAAVARLSVSRINSMTAVRNSLIAGGALASGGLAVLSLSDQAVPAAGGLVIAAGAIAVCWPLLMSEVGRGRERPGMVVGAVSTVGYLGAIVGPGMVGMIAAVFGLGVALLVLAGAAALIPVLISAGPRSTV